MKKRLIILSIFLSFSCKKKAELKDCGCDSPVTGTEANATGELYFFSGTSNYVISVKKGSSMSAEYFICNPGIIPREVQKTERYFVQFNGSVKKICPIEGFGFVATASPFNLTLEAITSITKK